MLRAISTLSVVALLFACTVEEKVEEVKLEPEATDATPADDAGAGGEGATSKVAFTLAKADALDGTTDKVVHKCAGCALGMDGAAENALELEGYTMHFCSGMCRDDFADGAPAKVLALNLD